MAKLTLQQTLDKSLKTAKQYVDTELAKKADSSHTHNYAGSSSAGGAATSANKVNTNLVIKLNGGSTEGTNLFTFNGSAAKTVNITPSAIGAAASSHNHTSLTGITSLAFKTDSSDTGSISTTIDGINTYFDFNLSDDPSQNDTWRWRFSPSGGTVFDAMTLDSTSSTAAKLTVTGNVTATSFTENGTALSSKYAASGHTHNYAGSGSAGGAAISANILNINNTETKNTGRLQYFQKQNDSTIMPDTGWWSLIRTQHAGYDNGYWQEMAYAFGSDTVKFRRNVNGTKSVWKTVAWTDSNITGSSGSCTGNAATATKLATARNIALSGHVTGSANFDGSGNITIATTDNTITTITKSLKVTTAWMDTGIRGSNLSTGTYAVQLYVNGSGQGGQWTEYYSGIMSWYNGTTNSADSDEIFLHKAGHATNGQSIYLRTIRESNGGYVRLQIAADNAFTAAVSLVFKFKKLI